VLDPDRAGDLASRRLGGCLSRCGLSATASCGQRRWTR